MRYRLAEPCSEDGCTNYIFNLTHRLCHNHMHQFYRKRRKTECSLEWCDKVEYSKGYCSYHYQRQRAGLPFVEPRPPRPECSFEGCGREAMSHQTILCRTHYAQRWMGKELTPIRDRRDHPTDTHLRQCRTCQEWKDKETEFYNASHRNNKQSECKKCHGIRARRNILKQQGRHEEAALL